MDRGPEASDRAPGAKGGLLDGVLSLGGIVKHRRGQPVTDRNVRLDEALEGRPVASASRGKELLVVIQRSYSLHREDSLFGI